VQGLADVARVFWPAGVLVEQASASSEVQQNRACRQRHGAAEQNSTRSHRNGRHTRHFKLALERAASQSAYAENVVAHERIA